MRIWLWDRLLRLIPKEVHVDIGEGRQTCDFLGCQNPVEGMTPWQMCDACYDMAAEWDDSEMGYA